MADENKTAKPEDASKVLKKLLDAHLLVATNKLGRAPTLDELMSMAGQGQSVEDEGKIPVPEAIDPGQAAKEPKILQFKIYYGMGDKKGQDGKMGKAADPNKILFYESGDGKVYDTGAQSWLSERPTILDHLPARPLMHDERGQDVLRAIANGVLDDEDYEALDKAHMINDDSKKVFGLYKKASDLNKQMQELEKSEEIEEQEEEEEEDTTPQSSPIGGTNLVASIMQSAGVQQGIERAQEELGEQGANLIVEIMQAALADVDEKTRTMVQQEIQAHIEPLVDAIEAIAQHIGLQNSTGEDEGSLTEPETDGMIES